MAQLWGGRFKKGLDQTAIDLSFSFEIEKRLYRYDLLVNHAHAKALHQAGFLSADEFSKIEACLKKLPAVFEKEILNTPQTDEDIHSCVERLVIAELGDLGKKLHTGKSRNDQVATDMRLYLKAEIETIVTDIHRVISSLVTLAERHLEMPFPGFTHFQIAQPVLVSHHVLAYAEKLIRDMSRFRDAYHRMDECPLGSAAMAGTNYPIDRELVARTLGFARLTPNSMDAVSARDHMLELLSAISISMAHFSQLSEELILWSSPALGFIEIGDDFTTGSSIMPQKKNPDMAELTRGKTGPVLGNFVALHEMVKGLPLTYNRDLQEDKPQVFQAIDNFKLVLRCWEKMLLTITFKQDAIAPVLEKGFILATEIADYLAIKGVPFRQAHEITGEIVQYALSKEKGLEDMSLAEYQGFSDQFGEDVAEMLSIEAAINRKSVLGGTALERVKARLSELKQLQFSLTA